MNYGLYLAKVVKATKKDNRLQIKVTPQMDEIEDQLCPKWPSFFRDEVLLAKPNDLVWVICSNDFSIGYILGMASYSTYENESYTDYSISEDLVNKIDETLKDSVGLSFQLANMKVEYWNKECIHLIERSTGGKIIAFRNGTVYMMRPNAFQLMIGDSMIRITEDSIQVKSKTMQLQSPEIGLGDNPVNKVLVTAGNDITAVAASKNVRA